jgi:hypothetical protein
VPFFLQIVDNDSPGSGGDTVRLLVGDAVPVGDVPGATPVTSGFSYSVGGVLESGDFALVQFGGDEISSGTPVS